MPDTLATVLPKIDIRNFSGVVAAIIREETKTLDKKNSKGEDLKKILSSSKVRKEYIIKYNDHLQKTISDLLPNEVILQVDKNKLNSFANDALRKLKVSTGGKYVDELLAPALGSSIVDYASEAIKDHLLGDEAKLNKVVNTGLSYLSKQGIKIKELDEVAVRKNFDNIQHLLKSDPLIDPYIEPLLDTVIQQANNLIKNNPSAIIISATGDVRKKFIQEYHTVLGQVKNVAKNSFNSLAKDIETLTENELKVNEVLDGFKDKIKTGEDSIKNLEGEITKIVKSVADIKNLSPDKLKELGDYQLKHAQQVAENLLHANIINSYLNKGVKIITSIDDFEKKAANIVSKDYFNEFKTKLDELRKPTFSSVVTFASETINDLDSFAKTMGALNVFPNAAKSVGKFVGYANIAIGVAAALLPPNPIGIIGALGSLGGLFGGGGPSIEEEMFKAMQDGFKEVNDRLDNIQSSLNNLAKMLQEAYKNIMQSLEKISNQLKRLDEKLTLINEMIHLEIYGEYNMVQSAIESIKNIPNNSRGLDLYKRWYKVDPSFFQALHELDKYTVNPDNLQSLIRKDFTNPDGHEEKQLIGQIELDNYANTKMLFTQFFKSLDGKSKPKNLLLIPPQSNTPFIYQEGSNLVTEKNNYSFDIATENYYNSYFISRLVDQYITLHPFFIINKNNQFEPYQNIEELISKDSQGDIVAKLGQSSTRLNNLLEVINYSIIQQNILAGATMLPFIDNALYGNDEKTIKLVTDALHSNELLQKNLATYFINARVTPFVDNLDLSTFASLYNEVKVDRKKLADFNNLLSKYGEGRLAFGFDDEQQPDNPLLFLFYTNPQTAEKVPLLVPDLNIILEQQMLYSDVLFALLDAKQKVITALLDLNFFKNIAVTDSDADVYKQVFFLQS